ncbi:PREDICTED: uncharacterized protein LOC109117037 [Tarenaya hassleriana]|uniref:uncharacterized protein LOC109117037 n=1 Tax=Tarenaya hassleriana TaxID=28532 RepID=UPI0008FCEF40|nr:PREDICTED: uncharacterized protein LOC109117037 [Tarenaya hassleriana]
MTRSSGISDLVPLDPELERTITRLRRQQRQMENDRDFVLPDGVEGNVDSTFAQYNTPKHTELLAGIRLLAIDMSSFELNPSTIQMLGSNAFRGSPNEDPNAHLTRFKMMCRSIKRDNRVTEDTLRLIAFPWNLLDAALEWCYDLIPDSIHTWEQLEVQFMSKNFPAHRTQAALSGIHSFKQDHGESLYDAWKRYKGYQKSCPHHGLDKNYLINTFFRGLRMDTKTLIRASSGRSIQNKSFAELEEHIEMMAQEEDAPNEYSRDLPRKGNDQTIQMVLEQLAVLNAKLEDSTRSSRTEHSMPTQEELGMYTLDERIEVFAESREDESGISSSVRKHRGSFQEHRQQIAQLASAIQRPSGSLPGNSETNPRAHVNAITLKSGKQVDSGDPPMVEQGDSSRTIVLDTTDDTPEPAYIPPPPRPPPVPFPSRLRKHNEDSQFAKFVEMLKKLEYFKDILTKKRVAEKETMALAAECSALIQHELPLKRSDPGSFSIPCKLGNVSIDRALCDLGAGVSLLPSSIFKKLNVGELKPTRMTLRLADRSIKYPTGILEDVPLKVGNFYIPVDFVVLDMDEDSKVPIILGRPFLNTADAVIHVRAGTLTMKIGDETVEFTMDKNLKQPSSTESACFINTLDNSAQKYEPIVSG